MIPPKAHIVQIVPKFPPAISGVGDYACILAARLKSEYDIATSFVVCDQKGTVAEEGKLGSRESMFAVHRVERRSAVDLLRVLDRPQMSNVILLHYAGYGFQRKGSPLWLSRALGKWKQGNSSRRLITMFHELFASGPIWKSSFWSGPFQKWVCQSIASQSDHCLTSLKRYGRWIGSKCERHSASVKVLPVFSNVGESSSFEVSERSARMVVFGGSASTEALFGKFLFEIIRTCRILQIDEVITIGRSLNLTSDFPVPVVQHRHLAANTLKDIIRSSKVGMMHYFPGYLGKRYGTDHGDDEIR